MRNVKETIKPNLVRLSTIAKQAKVTPRRARVILRDHVAENPKSPVAQTAQPNRWEWPKGLAPKVVNVLRAH